MVDQSSLSGFAAALIPEAANLPDYNAYDAPTNFKFTGIGLPWKDSVGSYFNPKNDRDIIRSSIYWILTTRIGERVMVPEFGSMVPYLIHEPNDSVTQSLLRFYTSEALGRWEPRITIRSVSVQSTENTLTISIDYTINSDAQQEPQNMAVPFNVAA